MRPRTPPGSRSILLVDDDPISLQIVTIYLRSEQYQVTEAGSGEQAIAILESVAAGSPEYPRPDAILIDLQMPGIDGMAVGRHAHNLRGPRPQLIAMSATKPAMVPPEGFDGFLLKPLDIDALRAALQHSPKASPSRRAPETNAGHSVLNEQVLQKLKAIMPPEALREIYTTYVTDTRIRIAELEGCARRGDVDGLRRCAHMIKGSAAMAGVSGIVGIASALETGTIPPENQGKLFQHLRIACDDVEQALAYNAP